MIEDVYYREGKEYEQVDGKVVTNLQAKQKYAKATWLENEQADSLKERKQLEVQKRGEKCEQRQNA